MKKALKFCIALTAAAAMLLMAGCNLLIPFGAGGAAEQPAQATEEPAIDQPVSEPVVLEPTTVVSTAQPTATPTLVPPTSLPTAQPLAGPYKGTVKPPGCNGITITVSGSFSMCGVTVASVTFKQANVIVLVTPEEAIPSGAGNGIVPAVRLTALVNNTIFAGPYDAYATVNLCYAVPAGRNVVARFFNPQTNLWVSLNTTVQSGQACAAVNFSGIYVLIAL